MEETAARAKSVVGNHPRLPWIMVGLSLLFDALKDYYRERLIDWSIRLLGETMGSWFIQNPFSILTLSTLGLLVLLGIVIVRSPEQKRAIILNYDETPFRNKRAEIRFLALICIAVLFIGYGAYEYSYRRNHVRPNPPTNIVGTSTTEESIAMNEGNIVLITDAESLCSNGTKTARGRKGIENLPGGPFLHKPALVMDAHRFRIQNSSSDPEHMQILFEVEITNRGEASIAKDWELCLSQNGKRITFEAQDLTPTNDIKNSLADITLQAPIEHGRSAKGWLLFVLPIDFDLREFTGSIKCSDYLDKRSYLIFSSK